MTGDYILRVVSNKRIAHDLYDMAAELDAPENFSPMPGQFAHIAAHGVFLRRPISIAGYDRNSRRVRFFVRAVGRGTGTITSMSPGDATKALLPLGNPFPVEPANGADVWLVGGGMGVAPLVYAAQCICGAGNGRAKNTTKSFIGFREKDDIFGERELASYGEVSTETGGFVTDLVKDALIFGRPDVIFACGPTPMLASLQKICREENLKAYVSLEARMGCGIGACLVCNCRKNVEDAEYLRVCKDGPVFDISEVELS